jgi:type I restriction enzyme M protein
MPQLENIEAIEKRLWSAADTLRANSNYASNEYFMPVMGLIFLRHAYSRFLAVKDGIIENLPTRGGKRRPLAKEDFSRKGAIFLRPNAQFDTLVALPDSADRAKALIEAMESIEHDYESLRGVLPKAEYQELDNAVLGQLLRTLNPEELKNASGDIFGRIYEYFLTQFADQKAHDGGEFFTPISLVQMIVNVIEPDHGKVLDPACGSGGMFVQSAHLVERQHRAARETLTFYGMEKNAITLRLAKMNLAVHGQEGNIQKAISYYEDPHELHGKADFVMANPPFNVDEVDADKIRNDPRLPFGLPGVNNKGKVSNGNYLWISYFYSYLNEAGRAGFVMSSQASSAGRDEAAVRRKLIESGSVDALIAIRSNFFYTRTVPCELWFLDRGKTNLPSPAGRGGGSGSLDASPRRGPDTVLMLDARNVYRKVTRKICDFSPEQLANLTAIVWLYRGQRERFLQLVAQHLADAVAQAQASLQPLDSFVAKAEQFAALLPRASDLEAEGAAAREALDGALNTFKADAKDYAASARKLTGQAIASDTGNSRLHKAAEVLAPLADSSRDLLKSANHLHKLAGQALDAASPTMENTHSRDLKRARREAEAARVRLVDEARELFRVRYFHRQARWLQERFPDAQLRDVPGLVKLVGRAEIEANDWSLSPGRYVGVAPEEVDEDFDFEAALRDIHVELQGLNAEAAELATRIARNFEELGA